MPKGRTIKLAVAAVAIASALGLTAQFATAASAGTVAHQAPAAVTALAGPKLPAVPDSSLVGCTWGSSDKNIYMCFFIAGEKTFVGTMYAWDCIYKVGRTLRIEITGPSFTVYSSQYYHPSYSCFFFTHSVNHDVKPGAYHAITWRYLGGKKYTEVGEVTWDVRA
jgi:hypothetical protein